MRSAALLSVVVACCAIGSQVHAQAPAPTNSAPNPYTTVEGFFKMPAGRTWGSTSAVEIDRDGRSIWVAERCGANSCLDRTTGEISKLPSILKFDASGKLVASFGQGLLIFPHGIYVDRDGNVWVTDGQDDAPQPAGAPAGAAATRDGPLPGSKRGHQVYKFSTEGKLLMTLGKPGGAAAPDYFYQPDDVLVAPSGEIFVSEGHGGANSRILKFSKDGKFLTSFGSKGSGPSQMDQPHALAMDSRGRLFVGDRNNNRVLIFDQQGKLLDTWPQFSRPSGLYIDKQDMLYVADSESESVSRNHDGWKRGIRVGNVKDGKVLYFIPDPVEKATTTSAAEGVAVDAQGNIYGAEVGPRALKKYVRSTRAAANACDRECLRGFISRYLDAMVAHTPGTLPLAHNVRFTEDTIDKNLGEGLWKAASKIRPYRLDILDTTHGVAASQVVVEEAGTPVMLMLRLKVANNVITEVETQVTRNQKEGAIFAIDGLQTLNAAMTAPVAPANRSSRADAIRLAEYYPAGLEVGSFVSVNAPFAPDAYRFENGRLMAGKGCTVNPPSCEDIKAQSISTHPGLTYRVIAVDEELGITLLRMNFGRADRYGAGNALIVWEAFKVYGGQIHAVEAFMRIMPAAAGSGWDTDVRHPAH